MKPTNDERREVAAKLRELAQDSARCGDDGVGERACRVLLGPRVDLLDVVDAHFPLAHLADLIEPQERTCHAVRIAVPFDPRDFPDDLVEVYQFRCSECSVLLEDDWRFCPNCGARVIHYA